MIWYGGRWTLLAPGVRYDGYASRESAVAAAQRLAVRARSQGFETDVLVQDGGGELSSAPPAEPDSQREDPPQDSANSPA